MSLIIRILITFVVYLGLLFVLSRIFKDFKLKTGGLITVTVILLITDWALSFLLGILSWPFKLITLGMLNFLINWIINAVILWVTDKFSDDLEIQSKLTLFLAAIGLALAHYIVKYVI